MTDKSAREILREWSFHERCGHYPHTEVEKPCPHCDGTAHTILAALEAGGFELRKKGAPVSWPETPHGTAAQAICAGCGGTIMGGGAVYIMGTQWFHSPQCAAFLAASNPKEEGK